MYVKQGDQYHLMMQVVDDGTNAPLPVESLAGFEVMFGSIRHYIEATDTAAYDPEKGELKIPLTQAETFALQAGSKVNIDLRVHFHSGDVIGIPAKIPVDIRDATSEVIL